MLERINLVMLVLSLFLMIVYKIWKLSIKWKGDWSVAEMKQNVRKIFQQYALLLNINAPYTLCNQKGNCYVSLIFIEHN